MNDTTPLAKQSPEVRFKTFMLWATEYERQGRHDEAAAAVEYAAEAAAESPEVTELLFRLTEEASG